MRGNTALANVLKMEGTELLFCYPANPLIEAAAIAGIRPIMSRTERTTVNMADGFTRVSNGRRTGVVVTQSGPGIENAFAGIAHAYAESTPVLILPGGTARNRQGQSPDFDAIDPDRAVIIDGLEMQQNFLAGPLGRNRRLAPIPDGIVIIVVFDARQFGFGAEGHGDRVVQRAVEQAAVDAAVALINLEAPLTVEAEPVVADKLRPGIFAAGRGHGVLLSHIWFGKSIANWHAMFIFGGAKKGNLRDRPCVPQFANPFPEAEEGELMEQKARVAYCPKMAKSSRRVCASASACSGVFSPMKAAESSSSITCSNAVLQFSRGGMTALGTNSAYS